MIQCGTGDWCGSPEFVLKAPRRPHAVETLRVNAGYARQHRAIERKGEKMDANRFDAIARVVGSSADRRSLLKTAAGGALGLVGLSALTAGTLADDVVTEGKKKDCKKDKDCKNGDVCKNKKKCVECIKNKDCKNNQKCKNNKCEKK
jgi:hypothetical protein